MGPLEYIFRSIDDWPEYLGLLLLFLALHLPLMRLWAIGVFDPLFVILFSGAMSCTLVAFMLLHGDAAPAYALSFTLCQLGYYAGLGTGRAGVRQPMPRPSVASGGTLPWSTLGIAAVVHFASTVTIWALAGIPLFRPSRLGAFVGSGGLGILERLAESSSLIALFCLVYLAVADKGARRRAMPWLFFVWYLCSVALSGSKGALLSVLQAIFTAAFAYTALRYRRDRFWGGRSGKLMLGVATVFAVLVVATQEGADASTAVLGLLVRIVSYADVYIYAYPDALIEQLQGDNALMGMFGGFLRTFRLIPAEWLQTHLGLQFTDLVFPELDIVSGPNPQHPVFGYHYFGALAPLFSFSLGLLTATLQRNLFLRRHLSFSSGLAAYLAYMVLVDMAVDFAYATTRLASMLIGLTVVLGPALLLHPTVAVLHRQSPGRPIGTSSPKLGN